MYTYKYVRSYEIYNCGIGDERRGVDTKTKLKSEMENTNNEKPMRGIILKSKKNWAGMWTKE